MFVTVELETVSVNTDRMSLVTCVPSKCFELYKKNLLTNVFTTQS